MCVRLAAHSETPTGHGGDEHPPHAACCRETRGHHSPGGGRRETPAINTKGLSLYNPCSSGGGGAVLHMRISTDMAESS